MLKITFSPDIYYHKCICKEENVEDLDESALRYYFLPGDIIIISNNGKICLCGMNITILDFLCSLKFTISDLNIKDRSDLDFTESDNQIFFEKCGQTVRITTTFSEEVITTTFSELKECIIDFQEQLLSFIKNVFGEKTLNNIYKQLGKILNLIP